MTRVGETVWRSWDRGWAIAFATAGAVGLLAAVPTPLLPIAERYRDLCAQFPVLAQLTYHLPPLPFALLFSLAGLAIVNGVAVATRLLVRTLRVNRRLERMSDPLPPRLVHAARSLGLEDRLTYLNVPGMLACCYGLVRPRVAVTADLLARLDDQELLAILAHERHHLRHRDPARYLALHALAAAAFMFPVASVLRHRLETRVELAADRAALAVTSRGALAGALLSALSGPRAPVVGAAGLSATAARIAHLAGSPVLPAIPARCVVASLGVLAVIVLALVDLAASAELVQMICPHCS
ncbi:MAG: M56 family metallopeptidase [Thermomicrobiales bacterium]